MYSAELAITYSYPTSANGIVVLLNFINSDRSNTSKFSFALKFFNNTWRNQFPYMAILTVYELITEIERTN